MSNIEPNRDPLLSTFFVGYREGPGSTIYLFRCKAEDEEHACEQARNAYPDADILGAIDDLEDATSHPDSALDRDGDGDYVLRRDCNSAWVTVGNISVCITRTDEGVVTDLYPLGFEDETPLASTYAHASEAAMAAFGDEPEHLPSVRELLNALDRLGEEKLRAHADATGQEHAQAIRGALEKMIAVRDRGARIVCELTTADDATRRIEFGLDDKLGLNVIDDEWAGDEETAETTLITLYRKASSDAEAVEVLEYDGNTHRDLEEYGLEDEMTRLLFFSESPETLLADTLRRAGEFAAMEQGVPE